MYDFKDLDMGVVPFPTAANVDNVKLDKAEYVQGQSASGTWESIRLYFSRTTEDGTKQTCQDSLWKVVEEKITEPFMDLTLDQTRKMRHKELQSRMAIYAIVMGISQEELMEACGGKSTFQEMAQSFCSLLESRKDGVLLYMKTIPDNKGYIRPAPGKQFVQNMNMGPCTMNYSNSERKRISKNQAPVNGVHEVTSGYEDFAIGEDEL